jgi:hypothetical protein
VHFGTLAQASVHRYNVASMVARALAAVAALTLIPSFVALIWVNGAERCVELSFTTGEKAVAPAPSSTR